MPLLLHAAYFLSLFPLLDHSHAILSQRCSADCVTTRTLEVRQVPGVVSTRDFLRRARHTSAVAGKYLYIDGGELSYRNDETTIYQYSSATLSVDLSQDWVNHTVILHTTNKPLQAPKLSSASLWYDEQKGLFYSGAIGRTPYFNSPKPAGVSLWSFKPNGIGSGTWKEEIPEGDSVWNNLTRSTFGYQSSNAHTALVLGGAIAEVSTAILQPGLLEFDMRTRQFTNSSATGFNANGTGVAGQMHFVPSFGPNGLFLIMGGYNGSDYHYAFDNIWVYEAVTHEWYNQTASGNVPEGRREFCVAGVNSTDGTYEIFLYGGNNGKLGGDAVPYDEIFVLTLPAWHWLKVDYAPQYPRGDHSCNAVGGSQIISIGGFDANPKIFVGRYDDVRKSTFNSTADPFAQGLGIFNMTSLAWEDHYTANAPPYEQSDIVKAFYRDNPQDGSQFLTLGLKELFQTTHFTPAGTGGTPSSNSTATPAPKPKSSPSNNSAIVGGIVGGVVGLMAIAGSFFYCWRCMRQQTFGMGDPSDDVSDPSDRKTTTTTEAKIPVPSVQEADPDAEFKGAQLDSQAIQELQQHPAELAAHGMSALEYHHRSDQHGDLQFAAVAKSLLSSISQGFQSGYTREDESGSAEMWQTVRHGSERKHHGTHLNPRNARHATG